MTATATKKRSKKAQAEEAQAKALNGLPEPGPAETPSTPPTEAAPEPETKPPTGETKDPEAETPAPVDEVIVKDLETVLEEESDQDADDDYIAELEQKAHAFDETVAMNESVSKAFQEWKKAHEAATAAKKSYEAKVHELRQTIHEAAHPEETPLFEKPKSAAPTSTAPAPAPVGQPSQAVSSATDDESWKAIPLREALPELSNTIFNKLEGAQLWTMGELAEYSQARGGTRKLTDIAGIGKAASGKIEDATMAFWTRWAARKPSVDTQSQSNDAQNPSDLSTDQAKIAAEAAAFRATPIPWSGLLETVPEEAAKLVTIGDLQKYANDAGILIKSALSDLGLNDAGVAAVDAWMNEQLDKVVDVATESTPDAADPLREFLATPIPWGDFDESPADVSKLGTVTDLENLAASTGLGVASALVNAGMTEGGAQVVVDWAEGVRSRVAGPPMNQSEYA